MENTFTCHNGTTTVTYKENDEVKQQLFDELIRWCKRRGAWGGEMIAQDDDCQIYAADFLARIVDDVLCFQTSDTF